MIYLKNRKLLTVLVALAVIALLVCGVLLYQNHKKYSGSTLESRELLLDKALSKNNRTHWHIATETQIGDRLVSGAYSTDGKATLAVFKPAGNNNFKFMQSTNSQNDKVIFATINVEESSYDLFWFNGAQTEYAEITYTINGQPQEPKQYDTTQMNIITIENNEKEYSVHAVYYDSEGNKYE